MVFGWGKKKQEEKPAEEIPQNKEISLVDVPKIISDLGTLRKTQTLSEINSLRNSTMPLIDDLIKIGNVLEKDSLNIDDIDKHLAIIVVRGKKQVIDMIKKDVVSLPKISSFEDAEKLNSTLNLILKKVGDVLGRQTRVIHIFAKKYAAQLKSNLEVMNSNHSEIQKLLKNYHSTKSLSEEILDTINQINNQTELRKEKSQRITEITENLTSINEKISSIQTNIDEIKSSENYKKYQTLKNTLDEFSKEKSKIKNQINTQFTKISRPLSRYEYASSLDKDQKNILSTLVSEPFDVLTSENKDSVIIILENVRKGVSSGSISVKDVEKTSSQITETEESLDGFVNQISEYHKKYQEIQSELASLKPEELISLENDLAKNTSSLEDSQLKSETFQGEIDEIDSKIPELVSEIEQKLREFSNTRYTILTS
ncbi:exonuclease SbcC [Nitrosopumilus cobalaminigenes]|uniref:Exonuclease SbcC n=1 Tax=Nitrosopumilus cobalaminigenes TaxID=1470066 RepID=A0A7D5R0C5_9ARCH|nr:exonuclease SbcC [Nitrosopumilus cobalaminigenes]QLH03038.1 exonuclease SbcC [Nitrosopumilus cobalaminigenes]